MNALPPRPDAPDPRGPAAAAELAREQLALLAKMVDTGMKLLMTASEAAMAPPPTPGTPSPSITAADPALTFARLSRAIRQTMALQTRIMEGPKPRPTERQRQRDPAARGADTKKKHRVRDAIDQAITAANRDADREDLLAELEERLDDPEFGPEFTRTPLGPLVEGLCQEFNLPFNGHIYTDAELGGGDPEWDPRIPGSPAAQRYAGSDAVPARDEWDHRPHQDYPTRDPDIDPCPD